MSVEQPSSPEVDTKLRQYRQNRGWSLNEMAALSGISIAQLSRAERGLTELSPQVKVNLARALRVDLRDLFSVPSMVKRGKN